MNDEEQYKLYERALREGFSAQTKDAPPLFQTDVGGKGDLFTTFLEGLPPERRQHYTCNACRRFINAYGGLVLVAPDGTRTSPIWGPGVQAPPFFAEAAHTLSKLVTRAKITGVFVSSEAHAWGLPENVSKKTLATWHHLHVVPSRWMVFQKSVLKTAFQRAAEFREEHGMLCRGLAAYPLEIAEQALAMLTNGLLYRSEKCIGVAKWLVALHKTRAAAKNNPTAVDALTWLAVARAPGGYCHVTGGMIGTLLEDIQKGLPFAAIKARFDDKISADNYQRAQVAPSAGNIAQAEKVIAELKATGSLDRRFARLGEIPAFVWRPTPPPERAVKEGATPAVFSHLTPKVKAPPAPAAPTVVIPAATMTWDKFRRTVLPEARSIEVQVPASSDRFMALVTATDPGAPPILQWDDPCARNPFSWYYANGIDAEIRRRVVGAGGMHEGCDIRASLIWNNRNDLDLYVVTPRGERIYYGTKRSTCGGYLDVDMNVNGETTEPIENTRWPLGEAPAGQYHVYVKNHRFHERVHQATPFRVELEVSGEVYNFSGIVSGAIMSGGGGCANVDVARFNFIPGRKLEHAPLLGIPGRAALSAAAGAPWGIGPGQWARVTGIVASPNLWGDHPLEQHGKHAFFLLDGCHDGRDGLARGFFVETLKGDFRPIRSTLEAYVTSASVAGGHEADACGVGMTDSQPWNLAVRVTSASGQTQTFTIDRWD